MYPQVQKKEENLPHFRSNFRQCAATTFLIGVKFEISIVMFDDAEPRQVRSYLKSM